MTKQDCIGTRYQPLGGGYAYASLRVGLVIQNPNGQEVYCQPGDDETAMRANLESLDEISLDCDNPKRATIADMLLSEYF
jgi:hypothetical protein